MAERIFALEDAHASGGVGRRPIAIVEARGAHLVDAEGKSYLDLSSAQGWANLGHSHPEVVAAIEAQARRIIAQTESTYSDQRAAWFEELVAALAPAFPAAEKGCLTRVHPTSSGAEAIETAIKAARLFTGRSEIVALKRGFHGRSCGAVSLSANKKYREPFEPLVPGVHHVRPAVEDLEEAITDETAALFVEVVQGEGGVHPLTADFLSGAQRCCRERGALLVVDEIQTGLGRTGRLFASEHAGLCPDVLTLGKTLGGGLPMGATVWREELGKIPAGLHGSTFGGNPLCCAASRAVLRVIREEGLVDRAARLGERVLDELRRAELRLVREVRGLGLMIGMELRQRVTPVLKELVARGVFALPAGPTVLRLLPPLNIEEEELERGLATVKEVLGG